jgi:hypothetical protein
MKKSPLAQVKERFGSKEKLVDAVRSLANDDLWIDRTAEDDGLELVSNKKLLHLHDVLTQVKERFGSRDKLIAAILEAERRQKDEGFKARLEGYSTPRLLDFHEAATVRAKRRANKAA